MFETIENESEKIYVLKEFDIFQHIRLFEEDVEIFIKNDHRDIVFDMRNLEGVDSMFLSIMLRFRIKMNLGGRLLRVINYNENILKCFQLLNMDDQLSGL